MMYPPINTARQGWTVFEDVFICFLQEMGISHCQVSFLFEASIKFPFLLVHGFATKDCERVVPPKLSSPEVLHCVEQTALRSFEPLGST